jgi:hypothetical protein
MACHSIALSVIVIGCGAQCADCSRGGRSVQCRRVLTVVPPRALYLWKSVVSARRRARDILHCDTLVLLFHISETWKISKRITSDNFFRNIDAMTL